MCSERIGSYKEIHRIVRPSGVALSGDFEVVCIRQLRVTRKQLKLGDQRYIICFDLEVHIIRPWERHTISRLRPERRGTDVCTCRWDVYQKWKTRANMCRGAWCHGNANWDYLWRLHMLRSHKNQRKNTQASIFKPSRIIVERDLRWIYPRPPRVEHHKVSRAIIWVWAFFMRIAGD